jgi:hypothetical protein
MRFTVIAILLFCLLIQNVRWDMTRLGWQLAEEQCAPFGGVISADEYAFWTADTVIKARCHNTQVVKRAYSPSELKNR